MSAGTAAAVQTPALIKMLTELLVEGVATMVNILLSDVVGPVNVPLVIAILLARSSTTSTPNSILMVIGLELVGLDDGDVIVVVNVAPTT